MDALTNIYNEMHSTHWESEEEMENDKPKEKTTILSKMGMNLMSVWRQGEEKFP